MVYRHKISHWPAETRANRLLGSAKPGHVKSSDRSAAKKTDDGYQGQGCACWISSGLTMRVNDHCVLSENSLKYALLSNSAKFRWIFMQIRQRIFKHTAMQVLHFFLDRICNFWHITRLSTTNHRKVINIQKMVRFFGPPCITNDATRPERSKSWPQYLWSLISQKPCEIDGRFKLTIYRKDHIVNPIVTWQMTSGDPKRSRSWPRYIWRSISQQLCEIHGRFIFTTNRKPHLGNPVVTWPITSRDRTVFLQSKFPTLIRSRCCWIKWRCQNCSETLERCLFCACALKFCEKNNETVKSPKFRYSL